MKTKLILTRFGGTFVNLFFDNKSLFKNLLGFETYWDFKPTDAIHFNSPGVYNNDETLFLSTKHRNRLKCDCIDGCVVNGIREPIPFSFVLDKPSG